MKRKGKQLLREGKVQEARDCFQQSIDVTPQMALEVMKVCVETTYFNNKSTESNTL